MWTIPYAYVSPTQGYYIETCARMRYKAEYAPSDLLCSRTGVWVPFDCVARALREDPGCVLSQVPLPFVQPHLLTAGHVCHVYSAFSCVANALRKDVRCGVPDMFILFTRMLM